MAAAAIPLALDLAAKYGPTIITLVKRIFDRKVSTTTPVATIVTIVADLDKGDANFQDNLNADAAWFLSHGYTATGEKLPETTGGG